MKKKGKKQKFGPIPLCYSYRLKEMVKKVKAESEN